MSLAAKQHIVLKDPLLLDTIQRASMKWDRLSARYYDSVDQVLKMRPFGLSWLLLYLDGDAEKMDLSLNKLTVSPDWRDLDWILFCNADYLVQAAAFQEQFLQIKEVIPLPCPPATMAAVYGRLMDPHSIYRTSQIRPNFSLPMEEIRAALPEEPFSTPSTATPSTAVPPPAAVQPTPDVPATPPTEPASPSLPSAPSVPVASSQPGLVLPGFSAKPASSAPVPFVAPSMPPPPQALSLFPSRGTSMAAAVAAAAPTKPGLMPPPPAPDLTAEESASANGVQQQPMPAAPKAPSSRTASGRLANPLVPVSVSEHRAPIDDRLVDFFKIHPSISDYALLNSEAETIMSSSETASLLAKECTNAMAICGEIGANFGFGSTVEIHPMSRSKSGAYFSINPVPDTLTNFRVVVLLAKRGAATVSLAAHLRKNI